MEAPTRILVPVDLSTRAEPAVSYAAMLAALSGAELVLTVNANLPEQEVFEELAAAEGIPIEKAGEVYLERIASRVAPGASVSLDIRSHDFPAEGILEAAESLGIDLIVLASHGRTGMSRWLLGSIAEKIARASDVPVVIVPART